MGKSKSQKKRFYLHFTQTHHPQVTPSTFTASYNHISHSSVPLFLCLLALCSTKLSRTITSASSSSSSPSPTKHIRHGRSSSSCSVDGDCLRDGRVGVRCKLGGATAS